MGLNQSSMTMDGRNGRLNASTRLSDMRMSSPDDNNRVTDQSHNSQVLMPQQSAEKVDVLIQLNQPNRTWTQKFMAFSSFDAIREMMHGDSKMWDHGRNELDIFNSIKFFHSFLILITCTATYLIIAAPTNPWIMSVFFDNVIFTIVIAGVIAMDCYFTYSAFFGFYRICQIYDAK